ncbi:hypothetical protein AB0B50_04535 [Streptomyces sp. NPDC041068]|uniref:hypothetical protein n=1 Tax=Streptomyces sp. NPDC041068 TaxID=3155130 RepID=UPI00340089DD
MPLTRVPTRAPPCAASRIDSRFGSRSRIDSRSCSCRPASIRTPAITTATAKTAAPPRKALV